MTAGREKVSVLIAVPGSVRERTRPLCVTRGSSGLTIGVPYEVIPAPRLMSATILLGASKACVFLPVLDDALVVRSGPPGDGEGELGTVP